MRLLTILLLLSINSFAQDIHPIKKGRKWQYINTKTKKEVTPPIFDSAEEFSEGMALVEQDGKYGFINLKGEISIPIQYDYAYSFKEGIAIVSKNNKTGGINNKGETIIPFEYKIAENSYFQNGKICLQKKGKYGIINTKNEIIIPFDYQEKLSINSNQPFIAKKENSFGLLSENGKILIPFKYRMLIPYTKNTFIASLKTNDSIDKELPSYPTKGTPDQNIGVINSENKVIIPMKYNFIYDPEHELIRVEKDFTEDSFERSEDLFSIEGKKIAQNRFFTILNSNRIIRSIDNPYINFNRYEIVNKNGETISKPFKNFSTIGKDLIRAQRKGKDGIFNYGIIDYNDKTILEFEYNHIGRLNNTEYFEIYKGNKVGLINNKGEIVLPLKYLIIHPAVHGLNIVEKKVKEEVLSGFINDKFEEVIPCIYEEVNAFNSLGLAIAKKNKKYGVINYKNEIISDFLYDNISTFINKQAIITVNEGEKTLQGIINHEGKIIHPLKDRVIIRSSTGEYFIQNQEKKWGLMNNQLEMSTEFKFEKATTLEDVFMGVLNPPKIHPQWKHIYLIKENNQYGFFDIKNKKYNLFAQYVLPLKNSFYSVKNNLYGAVIKKNHLGIANLITGEIILPFKYRWMGHYTRQSILKVILTNTKKRLWSYEEMKFITPECDSIKSFRGSFILYYKNNIHLINSKGERISENYQEIKIIQNHYLTLKKENLYSITISPKHLTAIDTISKTKKVDEHFYMQKYETPIINSISVIKKIGESNYLNYGIHDIYAFKKNKKWSIMREIIGQISAGEYDSIYNPFFNELISVKKGTKWKAIICLKSHDFYEIKTSFDSIIHLSPDFLQAYRNNRSEIITLNNFNFNRKSYDSTSLIKKKNYTVILTQNGDYYGFLDEHGKELYPTQFEKIVEYKENGTVVVIQNKVKKEIKLTE